MKPELIEHTVIGKLGPDLCEDVVHVSAGYIAVIDGATSMTSDAAEKMPGRIIAELVDECMGALDPDLDATGFFAALCQCVAPRLEAVWPAGSEQRPTASLIVYSVFRRQVWVLGDGWAKIDDILHELRIPYADAYTFLRCAHLKLLLAEGRTEESLLGESVPLDLIRPFIMMQPRIQNRLPEPYGYGVFDGSETCIDYVKVLSAPPGAEIVLASDGYPAIAEDLRATEAILQSCLETDPLMINRYPQVKAFMRGQVSYDDRSYVRFRAPPPIPHDVALETTGSTREVGAIPAEEWRS